VFFAVSTGTDASSTGARAGLIPEDLYNTLLTDSKYEPFRQYHAALTSRPSWAVRPLLSLLPLCPETDKWWCEQATFDEEYVVGYSKKRIEKLRAEAAAAK
jgi:hypothetical protein